MRQPPESATTQAKNGLWVVRVEPREVQATDKPERLVQTGDFEPRDLTITADGKRLSFLKSRIWQDVYLAELGREGATIKAPHRFTLDNRGIRTLDSWTPDSQAILFSSDRNGKAGVFRQGLNESVGEAVARPIGRERAPASTGTEASEAGGGGGRNSPRAHPPGNLQQDPGGGRIGGPEEFFSDSQEEESPARYLREKEDEEAQEGRLLSSA